MAEESENLEEDEDDWDEYELDCGCCGCYCDSPTDRFGYIKEGYFTEDVPSDNEEGYEIQYFYQDENGDRTYLTQKEWEGNL